MKLKETNNILEDVINASLKELSDVYSARLGETYIFDFWHNATQKDKDLNVCFIGVVDVRLLNKEQKVVSFKRVYDRMIIQRKNIGTLEEPKYGKQQNYEESRNVVLRELIGKSVAGTVLTLAKQTPEMIEELYKLEEEDNVGN